MTFKFIITVVLSICLIINVSGQGAYIPPEKPKLVIGIVVEQLRFDQLEKFRDRLCENGIRKLLNSRMLHIIIF
jgi:hypothetical protein